MMIIIEVIMIILIMMIMIMIIMIIIIIMIMIIIRVVKVLGPSAGSRGGRQRGRPPPGPRGVPAGRHAVGGPVRRAVARGAPPRAARRREPWGRHNLL